MTAENKDIILRLCPARREKLKRYLDSVVHGLPMDDVPADGAPPDDAAPTPDEDCQP